MQTITADLVAEKIVLLRFDIDVPIQNGQVTEDFRLKAGLPTLQLCLDHAQKVTLIGHIGRPDGKEVPELSIAPILKWFESQGFKEYLINGKLVILENLRFDPREEKSDLEFAKELAQMGDVFINEAFASYHEAASTTVLPTLLPHGAGLNFAKEVETLTKVREHPGKPLIAIMGGAKVVDKLPVIQILAKIADAVLVGGKIAGKLKIDNGQLKNVMVGMLAEDGLDITGETLERWKPLIDGAKMIIWNGPVGKIDNGQWTMDNLGTAKGSYDLSQMILNSTGEIIVGGGDTVSFLDSINLLDKFQHKGFVSTGGGAMLKFLSDGTLPTIDALS